MSISRFADKPRQWRLSILAAVLLWVVYVGATPEGVVRHEQNANAKCTIDGVVITGETGDPVAEAVVGLVGSSVSHAVHSDSAGRFRFEGISSGEYHLGTIKSGFVDHVSTVAVSGCPGATQIPAIVLARSAVLAGTLLDPNGEPASSVDVRLEGTVFRSVTNTKGQYRFRNVPGGVYTIAATPPRSAFVRSAITLADERENDRLLALLAKGIFDPSDPNTTERASVARSEASFPKVYFPGVLGPEEAASVQVAAGQQVEGLDFSLQFSQSHTLSGMVVGVDGNPSSGAVLLVARANSPISAAVATVYANNRGDFHVRGLPPASYSIWAWQSPLTDGSAVARDVRVVGRSATEWGSTRVELVADVGNVRVDLRPTLEVSGKLEIQQHPLVDPKNTEANVTLALHRSAPEFGNAQLDTSTALIAGDGKFTVRHLTEGAFRWHCSSPIYSCTVVATSVDKVVSLGPDYDVRKSQNGVVVAIQLSVRP